ncbi:MAG: class I SAM-dependent methyltransferase [Mariniblastus sp.]
MKLTAACAFGLEAIVKRELIALGYEPRVTQPGRISFEGDWSAVCRANIWLRTADRVLVEIQQFDSPDFDSLFETVKAFDWSQFIPADASFPVIGKSRLSTLTSVPAVQRSVKRALVESLKHFHGVNELPETGETYKVEIALLDDVATLTMDTTGPSLHKRGYRKLVAEAPLKETLAAALVDLSVWNPERPLVDPFCGSGTIAIEAALLGLNIAPGMHREFACSQWGTIDKTNWQHAKEEANDSRRHDVKLQIVGSDRDPEVLSLAEYHIRKAGVAKHIQLEQKSFDQTYSDKEYGCLITNPPYGERLEEHKRLTGLYQSFPMIMQRLPTWSLYLITNMPKFETLIRKEATRRRKLFNGRIECTYYQYLGPRPPRANFANKQASVKSKQESIDLDSQPVIEVETVQTRSDEKPQTRTGIPVEVIPVEVIGTSEQELEPSQTPTVEVSVQPKTPEPTTSESNAPDDTIEKFDTPAIEPQSLNTSGRSEPQDLAEPAAEQTESYPPRETEQLFGGLRAKDYEQAELFHNRLTKRAKHLRRWPGKRGITCFRLYERDIPEIPLVVDRYENHLHITEYERPHERDLARHVAWLDLMRQTAAKAIDIPLENSYLKQRHKDRESRQYEKVDSLGELITVQEGGLKFLVNLSDYVDTGLFLDHRVTRGMVRDEAKDKDFLNLFAYTGSFSAYAAAGGARSTTTVDLSKNYLNWAQKNLEANGLEGEEHCMIASDTIEFLHTAGQEPKVEFDLIVVDPPTYSNSKRTDTDWDIQSRYIELLRLVENVTREDGVVYFSTNFRRFKFDEKEFRHFEIREISKQTVPEDFRNRRIHRCWRMVKK